MMYKAVDDFLNDSFAFNKFSFAVNFTLNVLQIPVDKLTTPHAAVFICAQTRATQLWLSSVLHPRQHSIGHIGDGFTGQKT